MALCRSLTALRTTVVPAVRRNTRSLHLSAAPASSTNTRLGWSAQPWAPTPVPAVFVTQPAARPTVSSHVSQSLGALCGASPAAVARPGALEPEPASKPVAFIEPTTGLTLIRDDSHVGAGVVDSPESEPETLQAESTLRKRRAKMNKHKRRKWRRKMRNLRGKNLKQQ